MSSELHPSHSPLVSYKRGRYTLHILLTQIVYLLWLPPIDDRTCVLGGSSPSRTSTIVHLRFIQLPPGVYPAVPSVAQVQDGRYVAEDVGELCAAHLPSFICATLHKLRSNLYMKDMFVSCASTHMHDRTG